MKLSADSLLDIFRKLSPEELIKMRLVNHEWKNAAENIQLWKNNLNQFNFTMLQTVILDNASNHIKLYYQCKNIITEIKETRGKSNNLGDFLLTLYKKQKYFLFFIANLSYFLDLESEYINIHSAFNEKKPLKNIIIQNNTGHFLLCCRLLIARQHEIKHYMQDIINYLIKNVVDINILRILSMPYCNLFNFMSERETVTLMIKIPDEIFIEDESYSLFKDKVNFIRESIQIQTKLEAFSLNSSNEKDVQAIRKLLEYQPKRLPFKQ